MATAPVAMTEIRLSLTSLTAHRAFLLVRLDEALDEHDRMATDASQPIVHVLHGELRTCGRKPTITIWPPCWLTQPM